MGKKFEELREEMSLEAQKEVEFKVEAATNIMDKSPTTFLDNWRVLYAAGKPFLAALDVSEHPFIAHGPIITSPIVSGEPKPGETVVTQSGTNYMLGTELPKDDDCEFARPYLIERVSRNLAKAGQSLKLEQLGELNALIDRVLAGEEI